MDSQQNRFDHVVIVGASSGGIDALSRLVESLPGDFVAPVIVAQHLDPRRPSRLVSILSQRTGLRVLPTEDHTDLEPGSIYVIPSNRIGEFADSEIRVIEDGGVIRPVPSIDHLLESAADVFGERLIAVILTGSGSDGAAGAQHVKELGGTVIIQDPASAEYPEMPRSLPPTSVDFVRELSEIGALLANLVSKTTTVVSDEQGEDVGLSEFLTHLREKWNIDFSQYKTPTIARRLQRRFVATNTHSLQEYLDYLERDPVEYNHLLNSFLIKVTDFFRDAELFDYLRETVVPTLIEEGRQRGNHLRIWSAGCATGEEAYSLAIVIAEALGDEPSEFTVRIFATDIDEQAVAFGRRGVYSAAAVRDVPERLIDHYFNKLDGEYEISKQIRGMVVFGQHDLAQRSPFPSIDLVLCRNVLIYFTGDLQRRALQLFAYSLRNGGYLALGKSESTSPLGDYFRSENQRLKVYRRYGDPTPIPVGPVDTSFFSVPRTRSSSPWTKQHACSSRVQREGNRSLGLTERADRILFHLPMGIVVVDSQYDIHSLNNRARKYLGIHGSAVGQDLLHLVRTMSLEPLRDGIDQAFRHSTTVNVEGEWPVESIDGEMFSIEITCQYQESESNDDTVVIILNDVTNAIAERDRLYAERDHAHQENQQLGDRLAQLRRTNQQLMDSNRELAETNEDLRITNEQLMVSNEETQASAEEIETLNEELQTTNEELETLNEEMQATVEELNATNEDLQSQTLEVQQQRAISESERAQLEAILVSMGDAVLVVDSNGQALLTNDAFKQTFGEDLSELMPETESGEAMPDEENPMAIALRREPFVQEFTTRDADNNRRWFEASGGPIRNDPENPGSVLVIRDISDRSLRRLQEEFMSVASHELRTPLTALQGYLEILQRQVSEDDTRARRHIATALAMVHRLVRLVGDLLDVGRLQSGKFELALERVDLGSLVQQTVELGQSMTTEHQIDVEAPEGHVSIDVDPMRIQQVLLNLLTNAINFSEADERILVRLWQRGDMAVMEVEDFGSGIPQDAIPQIFMRFHQGDRPMNSTNRGLGLGLFISKQIVEAHGGWIEVNSIPGNGTIFRICLPIKADSE